MNDIKFSESAMFLFEVAESYARKMQKEKLSSDDVIYVIARRPDVSYFPKISYMLSCYQFDTSHDNYEKLPNDKEEDKNQQSKQDNFNKPLEWSDELKESVKIATQKADEKGHLELAPGLIVYGILKNTKSLGYQFIRERTFAAFKISEMLRIFDIDEANIEEDWIPEAYSLCYEKKYKRAVELLDSVLRTEPDNPTALYLKGDSLLNLGIYSEAVPYFDKLLKKEPGNSHFLSLKAYCLSRMRRFKEAITVYNEIEKIVKHGQQWDLFSISILLGKGNSLAGLGYYHQAVKFIEQALGENPNSTEALYSMGVALIHLKRYKDALKYFNKALAIEPDNEIVLKEKEKLLKKLQPSKSFMAAWLEFLSFLKGMR